MMAFICWNLVQPSTGSAPDDRDATLFPGRLAHSIRSRMVAPTPATGLGGVFEAMRRSTDPFFRGQIDALVLHHLDYTVSACPTPQRLRRIPTRMNR